MAVLGKPHQPFEWSCNWIGELTRNGRPCFSFSLIESRFRIKYAFELSRFSGASEQTVPFPKLESFQFEWKLLKNWRQRVLRKGESARCILVCSAAWLIFAQFMLRREIWVEYFPSLLSSYWDSCKIFPFYISLLSQRRLIQTRCFSFTTLQMANYLQQWVFAARKTWLILLWNGFQLQKSIAFFLFDCLNCFATSNCSSA